MMNKKVLNKIKMRKEKKEKKKLYKYIDKLFYRIFFSSICLLVLSICSLFNNTFFEQINYRINKNINFLKITQNINQLFKVNLLNNGDTFVYSSTFYDEVIYDNDINYVRNYSFNGVESLVDGVVIEIKKKNNLYSVKIQAYDDTIYCFEDLESIDVNLYNYVTTKQVIGKSVLNDGVYQFKLVIIKDNQKVSYYENAED